MNTMNCETVRDLYPDLLHEQLDATTAARVRSHISSCDDCRSEIAILDAIRRPVQVPPAFEERVVRAVRNRPKWRIGRGELAMAATLAAALIGGSAIMERRNDVAPSLTVEHVGAIGVEGAMLTGSSSLEDLSVEQLQKLLGDIES